MGGEGSTLNRPQENILSPSEFIASMREVLKRELILREIQDKREQANQLKGSDLVPIKNEVLWILKKQQTYSDKVSDYKNRLKNHLTEKELKALNEISDEFLLRVALVNQFLFRITKKELDFVAREADFALPPQLAPEIPKLFEESQGVRFTPYSKPQLKIEPK